MSKLKVVWTGSTPIEGKAEHESGDLLEIGEDVMRRGIVIDGVWTHPNLIKQISVISETVVAAAEEQVPEATPTEDVVLPQDGSEPGLTTAAGADATVVDSGAELPSEAPSPVSDNAPSTDATGDQPAPDSTAASS